MTRVEFVPLTKELAVQFWGEEPPLTVRAVAAVRDGKVLGISGVHPMGMGYGLFADALPEFFEDKRNVVRAVREVRKITSTLKMTLYAIKQYEDNTILIDRLGATIWPS